MHCFHGLSYALRLSVQELPNPHLQYEQSGCYLYQHIMEASYLLPKYFRDMIPGPLGYAVPTLSMALVLRILKPPLPRLLIL
jgi:hypothetical protein